jgi:hypothetical protein
MLLASLPRPARRSVHGRRLNRAAGEFAAPGAAEFGRGAA